MLSIGFIDAGNFASEIVPYLRWILEIDRAMEFETAFMRVIYIGKSIEGDPDSTAFRISPAVFRTRGIYGGLGI
jgi:hypothetical protein